MHRYFTDLEATLLDSRHQLHCDAAAVAAEREAVQHPPSNEPKVAIHVAHMEVERQAHERVIDAADDLAMQPILPVKLPALDHVDVRRQMRQQLGQLVRV